MDTCIKFKVGLVVSLIENPSLLLFISHIVIKIVILLVQNSCISAKETV